eukprot:GFUD01008326.1.p1 GENE.GFUD01008326.1~~GFUD01008326.1.p1  ORF type:complete len:633 (+),score=153.13 GFUD01008326.1:157-2055(+)
MENLTDELNSSKDSSRRFEHVKDNQKSILRDILNEAIDSLGGYNADVFEIEDIGDRLASIHNKLGAHNLNLETAQKDCVKVEKIQELVVNENSSVRDLNIAVLMTHWDYIASVYFLRGNALMTAKRWVNAINDFNMAIDHGYSDGYKAHHKIGQCYVKRKQYQSATKSFQAALDNLNSATVCKKVQAAFTKILKECISKFSAKPEEIMKTMAAIAPATANTIDNRLSDSVEIIEEVGKGRTAFAKSNIGVGSILSVDDCVGAHLNPDDPQKTLQYCLQCLKNVTVQYPCSGCPRVVYCSRECQQVAEGSFHKYQCQLDLYGLRQKDTKDGCTIFNSLTIIAGKPAAFWIENQSKFLVPNAASDWPTANNTELEQMTNLFDMITNENDVSHDSHVRHAVVAVFLLRSFRKTTFYKDSNILVDETGSLSKEELVIGKLMYRIRLIKDMNAHPIWGVENNPKDKSQVGTEQIGGGLYTAIASYFNSDCNPNTIRINLGKKMFLVASKNIRKGEEITDNYCIHFSDMAAHARREWIEENFLFSCECKACEEDWPTYNHMPTTRPSEKVSDKLVELEMDNMTALQQGNVEKAILSHCKEISLIQANLPEPHQLSATVRSSYQHCWWKKVSMMIQEIN